MSNEVYLDHEGKFWEGEGVSPHVPVQIFDPDNPFVGHVDAINDIIEGIKAGRFAPELKGN